MTFKFTIDKHNFFLKETKKMYVIFTNKQIYATNKQTTNKHFQNSLIILSAVLDHNIVRKHNNKSEMNTFNFSFDVVITRREVYNE